MTRVPPAVTISSVSSPSALAGAARKAAMRTNDSAAQSRIPIAVIALPFFQIERETRKTGAARKPAAIAWALPRRREPWFKRRTSGKLQEECKRAVKAARSSRTREEASVRRQDFRAVERTHLGRHQTFRSGTETRQHAVAGLGVNEAVAAQRLHVHENVFGALAAGEEPESARAVEPLDDDDLEAAYGARLRAVSGRRHRHRGAAVGIPH